VCCYIWRRYHTCTGYPKRLPCYLGGHHRRPLPSYPADTLRTKRATAPYSPRTYLLTARIHAPLFCHSRRYGIVRRTISRAFVFWRGIYLPRYRDTTTLRVANNWPTPHLTHTSAAAFYADYKLHRRLIWWRIISSRQSNRRAAISIFRYRRACFACFSRNAPGASVVNLWVL